MRGGVFNIIQSCKEAFVLSPVLQRGQVPRAEGISCCVGSAGSGARHWGWGQSGDP